MTSLTERYLAAALQSIPEPKRADVERELRSSIDDAVEERVGAGEERRAAERSVLDGLGDPALLAAGYTGRPNYLIGPELFPIYRHVVPRIIAIAAPIAAVVLAAVKVAGGGGYADAIAAGIGGAISAAIQIAFWATLVFVLLERADAAREARTEIVAAGRWTVDRLPEPSPGRVTSGETVGEVFTALLTVGGLLLLQSIGVTTAPGSDLPLLEPALNGFWLPAFIAINVALAALQVIVYLVGRWTIPLAVVFAGLNLAFALPVLALALTGTLVNPAFAQHVGWPPLAEGDGPVMLAVAVGTSLVTAWEIVSAFRRALRAQDSRPFAGASQRSV